MPGCCVCPGAGARLKLPKKVSARGRICKRMDGCKRQNPAFAKRVIQDSQISEGWGERCPRAWGGGGGERAAAGSQILLHNSFSLLGGGGGGIRPAKNVTTRSVFHKRSFSRRRTTPSREVHCLPTCLRLGSKGAALLTPQHPFRPKSFSLCGGRVLQFLPLASDSQFSPTLSLWVH